MNDYDVHKCEDNIAEAYGVIMASVTVMRLNGDKNHSLLEMAQLIQLLQSDYEFYLERDRQNND